MSGHFFNLKNAGLRGFRGGWPHIFCDSLLILLFDVNLRHGFTHGLLLGFWLGDRLWGLLL